jgi:hypothetical protein
MVEIAMMLAVVQPVTRVMEHSMAACGVHYRVGELIPRYSCCA